MTANGASPISNTSAVPARISLRKLVPNDIGAMKFLHEALFPIDYGDDFYERAGDGDGILGYAAVLPQGDSLERYPDDQTVFVGNNEQLVGFITTRKVAVKEISTDRRLIGVEDSRYDNAALLYILTLGVAEAFRNQGIASKLLLHIERQAARLGCSAVYLHVIDYNAAAAKFYTKAGYACLAELQDFYFIKTGRAPDASRLNYNGYIYLKKIITSASSSTLLDNGDGGSAVNEQSSNRSSVFGYYWDQFTRVCLPFGGSYSRRKEKVEYEEKDGIAVSSGTTSNSNGGGGSTWLRGLFTGGKVSAAHTA